MLGTLLGRYRIESKLGEGGMGVVWRAHDPRLGRDVALKVLPDELVANVTARARLLREARAAAALNHPNILTVYDVGEAGGHVYLALEFVPGESLAARIGGQPLPVATALRLAGQVAAAISHAHERGIVHRDIKPSNVLVTPQGDAKVLDFGIATRITTEGDPTRSLGLTSPGALVGTPSAMAPELWRGAAADARSDQWSFGVLLHQMLAGRPPFAGGTPYELSAAILAGSPAPLPEGVPPALRAVLARCMERDPASRYGSVAEVRAALAALAGGEPASEAGVAPPRSRRNALALAAGAALALAAVVVLAVLTLPRTRSRQGGLAAGRISSLAVLPLDNFSHDPEQQYFADGMTEELITRLAQLGIVRVISRTSVMRFRNATLPLPSIGRQLGVDAIVEGSVEQAGGRVRISAQLVRAASDEHLWAHSYERDLGDALALQDEVAGAIAVEVRGALALAPPLAGTPTPRGAPAAPEPTSGRTGTAAANPRRGGSENPAVVQAYLRGRDRYERWTPADARQALKYFDQAISLDSTFARAFASRAMALQLLSFTPETTAIARASIQRALILDPGLGEAHAALALFLFEIEWDWTGAEREFLRAIALNPNDADAHHQYSHLLAALGRLPEAREQADLMLSLDPLAPAAHNHMAWLEYEEGHWAQSEAADRQALALDPAYLAGLLQIAQVRTAAHQWAGEREALEEGRRAGGAVDSLLGRLVRITELGRRGEALTLVRQMAHAPQAFERTWTGLAGWYAYLGRREEGIAALDSAFANHEYFLLFSNLEPPLAELRSDPRYAAIRRRMRLPA